MSEDCGSGVTGSSNNAPSRVVFPAAQLDAAGTEALRVAWRSQDLYIDHLEAHNRNIEGSLEKLREQEERIKQQYSESQHRERVLVRRLAAKEQELQDCMAQIGELKSAQVGSIGIVGSARSCLLDPAVNVLVMRLKQELTCTRNHLEETQNEFSAWKFTPDSNTGKKLMAKCRLLHQENEELGKMTTSGRIAKLEGDLALQKTFSDDAKKSQSELDDFLQELDEDVEGMQSTILILQHELRASRDRTEELEQQIELLRSRSPPARPLTNGATAEDYDSEPALILKVSERERICDDEDSRESTGNERTHPSSEKDNSCNVNGVDERENVSGRTNCETGVDKKRSAEGDWSTTGRNKKQRRASVLSLDYSEEEEALTAPNGEAD